MTVPTGSGNALNKNKKDKEILHIAISHDELNIGVCVGRRGIREDDIEITEIVVYTRMSTSENFSIGNVR